MKIRKGQYKIKLKDSIGQLLHAFIDEREKCGNLYALNYLKEEDIIEMYDRAQKKNNGQVFVGFPLYISVTEYGKSLLIFPATDRARELSIEYYPQARRL